MKIVCMIGTPPYLNYFINGIAQHHEVSLVIREDSRANIFQKIKKKGLLKSLRLIIASIKNGKRLAKDYHDILGDQWQQPNPSIPLINVANINSDEVKEALIRIQPDLVLVHGTSLIKNSILANIPLVLNLHWGLSPYYKGSYCTEWALLNNDPLNIGYTIHQVTAGIDAGDVLTQGRVSITASDTANRINMKLTKEGTKAMISVIDRLKNGEQPVFIKQDNSSGNLYLVKHWTIDKQRAARQLDNQQSMSRILAHPSKQALPMVIWE